MKVSLIVSITAAGSGVGYYFAFYLPDRDAAIEASRRLDADRLEAERRAEVARIRWEQEKKEAAEKRAAEQRQEQIRVRYGVCIANAEGNYSANWKSNCGRVVQLRRKQYDDCMTTSMKSMCDRLYNISETPENCSLPTVLADSLAKDLDQEKNRCFRESQLGVR